MNIDQVSIFVQNQFPEFYKTDGPLLIEFIRCYYEWLEQEDNELYDTRNFLSYHDIDKTPDAFLQYFKNKYLYNVPSEILVNPRFLIKHIKEIYKAKGSLKGWKLLFRLMFNEDVELYFPSADVLKPSAGTWFKPTYLEVSNPRNVDLNNYVGKTIIGSVSGTRATVESVVSEPLNQRIITQFHISNIIPAGADFTVGELAVLSSNYQTSNSVNSAIILGSPGSLSITSGGQDFSVGNIIEAVAKDPFTGEILTLGQGAKFKVTEVEEGHGSLYYQVVESGSGYSYTPLVIQSNDPEDNVGSGGSFDLAPLTNIQYYKINTDALMNYANTLLSASTYDFPAFINANVNTAIKDSLTFVTQPYGSIIALTNIETGNSYIKPVSVVIREGYLSKVLPGTLTWNTGNNIISVANASFTNYLLSNGTIAISANNTSNVEYHIIESISNTQITTSEPIKLANTTSGVYRAYINPFRSQFLESEIYDSNDRVIGENSIITATPFIGSGIIKSAVSIDSGKGYIADENVKMYMYGAIQQPTIESAGTGYANGELLTFSGGGTNLQANGSIITDSNGSITSIAMTSFGSGYVSIPTITVTTLHGAGAEITTELGTYNTYSAVFGNISLKGIGRGEGRWTSTASFLNSDKKIQDSYFYQAFSYQLKASIALDKYADMLKEIYHPAGFESFFSRQSIMVEKSNTSILNEDFNKQNIGIGGFIIGQTPIG